MNRSHTAGQHAPRPALRAFTLVELLVVMGVIVIVAGVTVIALGALGRDVRTTSAQNAIIASLGNARALAMSENKPVLVVFRPRLLANGEEQVVDMIFAQWTGESTVLPSGQVIDRFVPVPNSDIRSLAVGIRVAGPLSRRSTGAAPTLPGFTPRNWDELYATQTDFPRLIRNNEWPGELIGVMYGSDGTLLTRNPLSDNSILWVDFNNDDFQQTTPGVARFILMRGENDETNVNLVTFLAIYDDRRVRELYDDSLWTNENTRTIHISDYLHEFADRIHFNRYTGVASR